MFRFVRATIIITARLLKRSFGDNSTIQSISMQILSNYTPSLPFKTSDPAGKTLQSSVYSIDTPFISLLSYRFMNSAFRASISLFRPEINKIII